MGRRVLLIAALAALGCTEEPTERMPTGPAGTDRPGAQLGVAPEAPDPHSDLACQRCHQGGVTERRVDAVPSAACASSGCHERGGAARVALDDVELEHREHGGGEPFDVGCAACHTHDAGEEPLAVTTRSCTLCHASELDGDAPGDCRVCHGQPDHMGFTSQGLAVPHANLPWIGGQCVRCHYDVGQPAVDVTVAACVHCHADVAGVTAAGAGADLHPQHTEVGCAACHTAAEHHIVAMSSAVDLACADCHEAAHGVQLPRSAPLAASCNDCHASAHRQQQSLMLGVAPASLEATPSDKFMAGLTCRSCHQSEATAAVAATPAHDPSPGADPTRAEPATVEAATVTSTSCTTCHAAQYETVLGWWRQGLEQRSGEAGRYVRAARSAFGGSPELARADSLLAFVRAAGGEHNLPLSHRSLQAAIEHAAAAYGAAGEQAPAQPDLGRLPRMGQCTYCHYVWREPRFTEAMPDRFHREVLGVQQP